MQRAYAYADEGGRVPLELEIAWRANDIGAETVLGERAPAYLVRRVALSGSVYRAFHSRKHYRDSNGAENWAEWARLNPEYHRLLIAAMVDRNE